MRILWMALLWLCSISLAVASPFYGQALLPKFQTETRLELTQQDGQWQLLHLSLHGGWPDLQRVEIYQQQRLIARSPQAPTRQYGVFHRPASAHLKVLRFALDTAVLPAGVPLRVQLVGPKQSRWHTIELE